MRDAFRSITAADLRAGIATAGFVFAAWFALWVWSL